MPFFSRSKSQNRDNTSPPNVQLSPGFPPPYQLPDGYQNFHHYQNTYSPIPSPAPSAPVYWSPSPLHPVPHYQAPPPSQNVGYQPGNYLQQPNSLQGPMALLSASDTAVAIRNPALQTTTQWEPPPPPLPQRASPGSQITTIASPPTLDGFSEPIRASSSTSTRLTPSSSFAFPSPSRYLETPTNPWAQPSQARSPSPAMVPQRKTGQQEQPKLRKILSLGT